MKTLRLFGMLLLAISLCLSACGEIENPIEPTPDPKPEEVKSEITIDADIITNGLSFTSATGEKSISFSTNEDWTLSIAATSSGDTWCTASATSGAKGNANIKFTVTENTSYDDRSVSVTIKSGTASKTFTITQKYAEALLLTTNKYELCQEGGTIEIEIKANIDFEMEIAEGAKDWITEATARALSTYKHTFNIATNEEVEKREGEIYFKSGDKVETVKIYQTGGAVLMLSKNEYTVSAIGGTITVDINSNIEYGVQMPDVDWITDEAITRGMSSHTLNYIIAPNEEYDNRTAEIIFYDKNSELKDTLKIAQTQKDAIIISQTTYEVDAEGGSIEVKLLCNIEYQLTMPEVDWIRQIETRALTEHTLLFNISKNSTDSRSARIIISNKDTTINDTLTIKQHSAYGDIEIVDGGSNAPANVYVKLHKAGTLKNTIDPISASLYKKLTKLTVAGPINGDDIYYLRQMFDEYEYERLNTLDLSKASIVDGGSKDTYTTSNDEIGRNMFSNFSELSIITLPDNAISIGSYAFDNCSKLRTVYMGEEVTSIGASAFLMCSNLSTISIGKGVISIGEGCFRGCSSLSTFTIPDNVTSIGSLAFYECLNLNSITIGKGITAIADQVFAHCLKLSSVIIRGDITWIGSDAFSNCPSLTFINLPSSIKTIGRRAFSGCSSLTSIDIPDGLKSILFGTFTNCSSLSSVTIGSGVTSIESGAFSNCTSLSSIVIPDSVTSIEQKAFSNCSSLDSVSIGNGVTSINHNIFEGCSSLTTIVLGDKITSIDRFDFHKFPLLASVTIGNGVSSIGANAFENCNALSNITIGNNVTSIGESAFSNCTSLSSIVIPDSVNSIEKSAFQYCDILATATIGNGVISIGEKAFASCKSLTSIIIPNKVTNLGIQAFYGCTSLKTITIGNGVSSIGGTAFRDCDALTSIVIPDNVTSLGYGAFIGCDNLTSVTIGNGITSIDGETFAACESLTTVTIGNSVNLIDSNAFSGCKALSDFYCNAIVPPAITTSSFHTYENKTCLYVPAGTISEYQSSDWSKYFQNIKEME